MDHRFRRPFVLSLILLCLAAFPWAASSSATLSPSINQFGDHSSELVASDQSLPFEDSGIENSVNSILQITTQDPPLPDPTYTLQWKNLTANNVDSSPAVADVDEDGAMEVLVGCANGSFYCLNGSTGWVEWKVSAGTAVTSAPVIADVDDDNQLEIIVGSHDGSIYCFSGTGTQEWKTIDTTAELESSPAVADVDKDGDLEVLVGCFNGSLFCFDGPTGNFEWQTPTGDHVKSSPAVGDVDNDGDQEIIIGSYDKHLYCFDGSGNEEWNYTSSGEIHASPVLGDTDNDDEMEIFFGSNDPDKNLYCLDAFGNQDWSYLTGGSVISSPVLADVNYDGWLEIIFTSLDGKVYCLDRSGNWKWDTGDIEAYTGSLCVVDGDGDGKLEIYVTALTRFYCLNENGTSEWFYVITEPGNSSPVVVDVDGDDKQELIFGEQTNWVYCFDISWEGTATYLWPSKCFRGNPYRTGFYNDTDSDTLPDDYEICADTDLDNEDTDGDTDTDDTEFTYSTHPHEPVSPAWVETPTNQTFELGYTVHYDLNATDYSPLDTWWISDITNFSIDTDGIVSNNTFLDVDVYTLQVWVNDTYNNIQTAAFNITIVDNTSPEWVETPENQTIEFLSEPVEYNLNATDLSGSLVWWISDIINFSISSGGVITNDTTLEVREYVLNVGVSDKYENSLNATITITVEDNTPPEWVESPTDQDAEYLVNFTYNLDATDPSLPLTWWVNGTTFNISSEGIITNNTGLGSVGTTYLLRIGVSDKYGNSLNTTITITVEDTTAPDWVGSPTNQDAEYLENFSYDLDATDPSLPLTWWVNGTTFNISPGGTITNATPLGSVGTVYLLRIGVSDNYENSLNTTITITVEDTTPPEWVETPDDYYLDPGDSLNYNLNASDPSLPLAWRINNTENFSIDTDGIITNITDLTNGWYGLQVWVNDSYDNSLTTNFTIIIDITAPSWLQSPTDQSSEYNEYFSYDLNATDTSGLSHWWISDSINFTIDASGVITNNTYLEIRDYELQVWVNDTYNNILTATFNITVEDTTAPEWVETPDNQTIEFISESLSYNLNATDLSEPLVWWISDIINFSISVDGVITNSTTLAVRDYVLNVGVSDQYGNPLNATITITVEDTTAPEWVDTPENQTIEFTITFLNYNLNASDPSGSLFWWINDTDNFSIDVDGIITNSTTLAVGVYGLSIGVCDDYENSLNTTIIITVEDTTAPEWVETPTSQDSEYDVAFGYNLNATDPSPPLTWWVNDSDFYIDANGILTNDTKLEVGVYWLEIKVYDFYNYFNTVTFNVTVQDTLGPTWDENPTNQAVEYLYDFTYDLNASDPSSVIGYWINDSGRFSIDSSGLITNVTTIPVGIYWVEVKAYDFYSNEVSANFSVTVQDSYDPTWDETPGNQIIEFGSIFGYEVNASDNSGIDYYWVNDTVRFNVDDVGLVTNATDLEVGTYWLEVRAYDICGRDCSANFSITVQDNYDPIWSPTPTNQVEEYGNDISFGVNAWDLSGIDYYWVNDSGRFDVDGVGLITNVTELDVDVYWLVVRAFDNHSRYCEAIINVTIEDTTDPNWGVPAPENQVREYGVDFDYDVDAWDLSGISSYWVNDTPRFDINGVGLITNVTDLDVGTYWLEIRAYDPYGGYCTCTIQITIQDSDNPTWVSTPIDQVCEYGDDFDYDVDAWDLSGIDYYWVNDTPRFDISGIGLICNITDLDVGTYWLEVRAYDPYGGYCTTIIRITVQDITPPTWIEEPDDQVLEVGEMLSLQFRAYDLSGIAGWEVDDTIHFRITNTGFLSNPESLPPGIYTLTVTVNDPYDNMNSTTFTITVPSSTVDNLPIVIIGSAIAVVAVVALLIVYWLRSRARRKKLSEIDQDIRELEEKEESSEEGLSGKAGNP